MFDHCKTCEHTEEECKGCYPEFGYKNNKLKRDTEAVEKFVESDYFKKLMESLDKTDESNIEFIMPEATMHVDPIQDESINIIDFVHGYDYCINAMKKEIHKLFEDTINGTAGEFTRGWNLALRELLKAMEKPFDPPTESEVRDANKEYEAKIVNRGKCMICGKELTEGLFFCKECEEKAKNK